MGKRALSVCLVTSNDFQDTQPGVDRGASASTPGSLGFALLEERLQVDRIGVDRGGVRISKRIETIQQEVDEPLLEERIEVERRPIGLCVDQAPASRQEGDTLVVPIVREVLVTEKRLMLVEEIRITRVRRVERHTETVSLRKEVAEIERLEPEPVSGLGSK